MLLLSMKFLPHCWCLGKSVLRLLSLSRHTISKTNNCNRRTRLRALFCAILSIQLQNITGLR